MQNPQTIIFKKQEKTAPRYGLLHNPIFLISLRAQMTPNSSFRTIQKCDLKTQR